MTAGCLRPFSTLLTGKKASRSVKLFRYGPLAFEALDRTAGVVPTKTKRIAQRSINLEFTRLVGAVVEIAVRILIDQIDGRRHHARFDGFHTGRQLHTTRCAQQMTRH